MTQTSLAAPRRDHPRAVVRGTACYLSDMRIIIARSGDVSLSGMYVETLHPDPVGTVAQVRLVRGESTVVLTAEVVRVCFLSGPERKAGMGLRFCRLKKGARRFLASYVAAEA